MQPTMRPSLTSPHQPPKEYTAASPSYLIVKRGNVIKFVEVVVYHPISLKNDEDCERMTFLSASGHDGNQSLGVIEGGRFQKNENFGTINLPLEQFSKEAIELAIAFKGAKPPGCFIQKFFLHAT